MCVIPDIPALRQPEMVSTDRDLGPKVPTILVIAGKKLCTHQQPQLIKSIYINTYIITQKHAPITDPSKKNKWIYKKNEVSD